MTPSELKTAGERLYGPKWRQPLAARLGVNIATLRRWTSGKKPIRATAALAVEGMLHITTPAPRSPSTP